MKLLVTDNSDALTNAAKFSNRRIIGYDTLSTTTFDDVDSVLFDGYDQEIMDSLPDVEDKCYTDCKIDFNATVSELRTFLKEHKKEYVRSVAQTPKAEDNYIENIEYKNKVPSFDDDLSDNLSVREQIDILEPLLNGKKLGAGTIAELTAQLTQLSMENGLFLRDKITGLYKTVFSRRPLIGEAEAQTIFETHFVDKLAIKRLNYKTDKESGEVKQEVVYKSVSRADIELLWRNLKLSCTFNSRKTLYDSIPKWDGEVRIMSFMKEYFNCDANPNFFLLLMTSIIGKIVSPEKNYCPYFFDIVSSSKGIGKSLLCRRLLGNKHVAFLPMTSRKDDFFVNAYDGNNVLIVDDECTWCGKGFDKISPDELKTIVTNPVDKYSRKFQQPEEHDRAFVIVRTSNDVNQVFSTNERRQIIFQCNLEEQDCRIIDLPDSFFEQMLAEAKDYYEKFGMYKLTNDDWKDVKETNKENYNWETPENFNLLDFVEDIRVNPVTWCVHPIAAKFANDKWSNYKMYVRWCEDNKKDRLILGHRAFWRAIKGLSDLEFHGIFAYSEKKFEVREGGHCRLFRIDNLPQNTTSDDDDLPL